MYLKRYLTPKARDRLTKKMLVDKDLDDLFRDALRSIKVPPGNTGQHRETHLGQALMFCPYLNNDGMYKLGRALLDGKLPGFTLWGDSVTEAERCLAELLVLKKAGKMGKAHRRFTARADLAKLSSQLEGTVAVSKVEEVVHGA